MAEDCVTAQTEGKPSARSALDEVDARLQAGDLHAARKGLIAARKLAGPMESERIDALEHRLASRERLAGPTAGFEAARGRRDWVAARANARRAGELAEGEEATAWRARADACSAKVHAEWRIEQHALDVDATREMADAAGALNTHRMVPSQLLTDDGATLVLVTVHGRWVFVREVDVETRRLRRIGWLRAPESLGYKPPIQVDGGSIHLVGWSGAVLTLSRAPLDVVRWTSLRPFMLPDRGVQDALTAPHGRFLWAQLKEPGEGRGLVVVDLDEWRVCARPGDSWAFDPVPGARPARMLGTLDEGSALYDERGTRVDWRPPSCGSLEALVAHPSGTGLLALASVMGPSDGDFDDPLGLVEMLPGRPPSTPFVIAGTQHEQQAVIARRARAERPRADGALPRTRALATGESGMA